MGAAAVSKPTMVVPIAIAAACRARKTGSNKPKPATRSPTITKNCLIGSERPENHVATCCNNSAKTCSTGARVDEMASPISAIANLALFCAVVNWSIGSSVSS